MCGRYVSPGEAEIERLWNIIPRDAHPTRHYNVAPSTSVPIICLTEDGILALNEARWGLIPHWWKQGKPPHFTINARSEEVAVKPMWRDAYRRHRCLMPACGWYEWRTHAPTGTARPAKTPYYIHCPTAPLFAFAGLMAHWKAPNGNTVTSCALLTTTAAPDIAYIHDRMPLVLPQEACDAWLDPRQSPENLGHIVSAPRLDFTAHPVSTRVNSPKNDDPECITPVSEER